MRHGKIAIVTTLLFGICFLGGKANSSPLIFMPFHYGTYWYCPQGQNGTYTHTGHLRYAIDLNGGQGADNDAFGESIFSPVNGTVVEVRDGLADFTNNDSSNKANYWGWGNTVVILDEAGNYYIRFAHMKYLSTEHLIKGDEVRMGDYLGQVGQTGHSTGPHLHIQVMSKTYEPESTDDHISEKSSPFTFAEGKIYSGDWIKSGLSYNMSMLDNNGDTTLSHFFDDHYIYFNGSQWQTHYGTYGYAGEDFRRHYVSSSNDNSMFSWHFSVKQSGLYMLFVTFEDNAANDTNVEYYLDGRKIKTLSQKVGGHFYKYIGLRYISAGVQHTVSVRGTTRGKYVVADALVLRKFG